MVTLIWTIWTIVLSCYLPIASMTKVRPALLIAKPSQIPDIDIWFKIESQFTKRLKEHNKHKSIMDALFEFPEIVEDSYPHPLNRYHEMSLSYLYAEVIEEFDGISSSLIQILRMMIYQNGEMGIKLNLVVWDTFFDKFFELSCIDSQHALYGRYVLDEFNGLLGDLEGYFVEDGSQQIIRDQQYLIEMLFENFHEHGASLNLESYRLLERLQKKFKLSYTNLPQSHPTHARVEVIMERLRMVEDSLNCDFVQNMGHDVVQVCRALQPNCIRKYTQLEWKRVLGRWIETMIQTANVDALETNQ